MDTNFIKKVALSGLILGAAFTVAAPSYAAANATVVMTEDGKEKIFTGISKEALHIRSGASVTEKSLAILPKGTFVKGTVYETEATKENPYDEWIKIKYLDVEGYIAKDFLKEAVSNQTKSAPAKVKNIVSAPKKAVVAKKAEKAPVKEAKKYVQKAENPSEKAAYTEEKAVVKEAPVKEAKLAAEEVSVQKEAKAPVAEKTVQEAPVKEEKEVSKTPAVEEKAWTSGNENEEAKAPVKEEKAPVKESPAKEETTVKETPVQEAPAKEEPVQEAPVKESPVKETPVVKEPVQEAPVKEKPAQENNSGSYTTQMQATAYTATGNRTATGTVPKKGTIAVDPDVIPLGTELYVEGYGNGIAEDTGSAVKGNIIDLYMDSEQEARNWGRKNVNVTIYNYK